MFKDPIVEEVRKARAAYARKFGYDLDRIIADLRAKGDARRVAARAKAAKSGPTNVKPRAKRRKAA